MDHHEIERIALALMDEHGCHTMVLYGSHARGDANEHSDIDLMGIRADGPSVRVARVEDGLYIDAFVYPEAALATLEPALLRVLGGKVLRERDGFGAALLARICELHDRGPVPLPDDERQALTIWSQKMLDRFRGQRGLEIDYRRMTLVTQALDDYFLLRGAWARGPKAGFAWLVQHDEATYLAFEQAARPGADDGAFAALVKAVYGSSAPASP